jgi:hypothetical protein
VAATAITCTIETHRCWPWLTVARVYCHPSSADSLPSVQGWTDYYTNKDAEQIRSNGRSDHIAANKQTHAHTQHQRAALPSRPQSRSEQQKAAALTNKIIYKGCSDVHTGGCRDGDGSLFNGHRLVAMHRFGGGGILRPAASNKKQQV